MCPVYLPRPHCEPPAGPFHLGPFATSSPEEMRAIAQEHGAGKLILPEHAASYHPCVPETEREMLGSCRRHPKPNVLSAAAPGRAAGSNHRVSWKKLRREGCAEGSGGLHVASKALRDELDGSPGLRPALPPHAAPLPAASSSSPWQREGADSRICSPAASPVPLMLSPSEVASGIPRRAEQALVLHPGAQRGRGAEAARGAQAAAGGQGAALGGRFDAGGPRLCTMGAGPACGLGLQ